MHADGTTIEALEADITRLDVDAIANAANTDLAHGGGVAGAIVRAGGRAIQDESYEVAPSRTDRGRGVRRHLGEGSALKIVFALRGAEAVETFRKAIES